MTTIPFNQVLDVFLDEFSSWYNWKFELAMNSEMPKDVINENVKAFSTSCHAILRLFPDKKEALANFLLLAPKECWILQKKSKQELFDLFFV